MPHKDPEARKKYHEEYEDRRREQKNAYQKEYLAKNKEKINARRKELYKQNNTVEVKRALYRKNEYGISKEDFDKMLQEQNNICLICQRNFDSIVHSDKRTPVAVDHCHDTGKIRGLLCNTCNTGIGLLKHDIANLQKAITYLLK